jgi:hypothetical protein
MICHIESCNEPAVMAVTTNLSAAQNVNTKIFWNNESSDVPKKAEHYCADHGFDLLDSLWKMLTK